MRAAAKHDEPPVAGHVVVRDREVLTEVVFVSKEGCGFPEGRFGSGRVESDCHHPLTAPVIDLPAGAAPPRLHATTFRNLPLTIQGGVPANVDLRLA